MIISDAAVEDTRELASVSFCFPHFTQHFFPFHSVASVLLAMTSDAGKLYLVKKEVHFQAPSSPEGGSL